MAPVGGNRSYNPGSRLALRDLPPKGSALDVEDGARVAGGRNSGVGNTGAASGVNNKPDAAQFASDIPGPKSARPNEDSISINHWQTHKAINAARAKNALTPIESTGHYNDATAKEAIYTQPGWHTQSVVGVSQNGLYYSANAIPKENVAPVASRAKQPNRRNYVVPSSQPIPARQALSRLQGMR